MKKIFNVVAFSIMLFFASCEQDGLGWKADGIGAFSVSADKQVTFSPSNLSYNEETNQWSFLENQLREGWELGRNSNIRDVFGLKHLEDNGYQDWGVNKIGNDDPNTWRTLTYDEWYYLQNSRTNANDLCGVAQVNGVNGLIFLPDNWTCPAGVTFKSGFHNSSDDAEYYAAYQTFTADQWSKLEKSGAVFLPATGYRGSSNVFSVQSGGYWSATEYLSYFVRILAFSSGGATMSLSSRYHGRSVRLVKDVQ